MDSSFGSCIPPFKSMMTCKITKISWAAKITWPENQSLHGPQEKLWSHPHPTFFWFLLGKVAGICLAQSRYSIDVHAFLFFKKERVILDAEV